MEPARKLQKISQRQKITITAFPLKTDSGIQNVYACSACKLQFETVALATTHIVSHKKKGGVKDHVVASGDSRNGGMVTSCSDTVRGECDLSRKVPKRNLDGSPKRDNCLQVGSKKECIGVGITAIRNTDSVKVDNGTRHRICNANKGQSDRSVSRANTNLDCAAPGPSEKSDESITMSKDETVKFQVSGKIDSYSDTDDAAEDETSIPYTPMEQDGCPYNSTVIGDCSVVLERLENTKVGQNILKSCPDKSIESNVCVIESDSDEDQEQGQTVSRIENENRPIAKQNEEAIDTPKSFVCTQCSVTFSKMWCYANHLLMYHCPFYEKKGFVSCPVCSHGLNVYDSYYNFFKIHMARKHDLSEMKCLKCKEMFKTCSSLFTHIQKCKVDLPRNAMEFDICCSHCNVYHILNKRNNSHEGVKKIINKLLKCMPEEKAAATMVENASIITENAARKAARPKLRCRQCAVTFTEFSCCVCHIAEEHAEHEVFTKTVKKSCLSVCGNIPCGKKHTLSIRDVEKCRYLLENAGVLSRDLKSGGAEKVDEFDANEKSLHRNTDDSRTDVKSRRLQCLERYFDFDKSLLSMDNSHPVKDITKFDLISASTKEEIGKDMVHRIERTDKGYECAICSDQFLEYGCCKSHVLTIHSAAHFLYTMGSEVFTCPVCAISFHNIYRFDQHLEFHGIFKYCCKKCNLLFNNSSIYQKHLKHATPETLTNKSYSCSSCGLIHNCVVLEGEQDQIKCNDYPKRPKESKKVSNSNSHFNQFSKEYKHIPNNKQSYVCSRIGFDGDSYVCLECKKTYHDFECCSSHIVIQHANLRMTCLICNKLFDTRFSLNSHLKTEHQLETFLYCPCCFKSFVVESELTKHRQKCTDKRSNSVLENRLCRTCCQLHVDIGIRMPGVDDCRKCQNGFEKLTCHKNHYYREHFQCQIVLLSKYCRFQCPGGRNFLKLNNVYKHIHEIHINTSTGVTSQDTGRSSQISLPFPEKSMDFVQLKDSKSDQGNCSISITSGLDECSHCNELHVIQSQHVEIGSSSSKRHCKICKVHFKSAKCLKNHLALEHGGKRIVCQCVVCGKWFYSLKLLKLHQGRTECSIGDTGNSHQGKTECSIGGTEDSHQGKTERSIGGTEDSHQGKTERSIGGTEDSHQGKTERSIGGTDDSQPESSAQSVTGKTPADNERTPADNERTPADNERTPADNERRTPADNERTPADNERTPADNERTPADNERTPADNERTPADNERTPADNERTPAENERTPADNERTPADNERTPADNERRTPADNERTPADNERRTPAYNERTPADNERTPADNERTPADNERRTPADNERTPADNERRTPADNERRIISTIGLPIFGAGSDASKANKRSAGSDASKANKRSAGSDASKANKRSAGSDASKANKRSAGSDANKANKKRSSVVVDRSAEGGQCDVNSSCTDNSELTCTDCSIVHVNKFDETEKEIITGNIFDAIDFKVEKRQKITSMYLESTSCTVCGEECGSMSGLYKHLHDVHLTIKFTQGEITNTSKQAYTCSYCPEKFRCSMDGQLHVRVHHSEKPLVIIRNKEKDELIKSVVARCPVCFARRGVKTPQDHLKTHFRKLALYVCDICGKALSTEYSLKEHVSAKHTDQPAQHKCTVCGKCFKFNSNLWCHMKSHMEKKEACPVCDMKFTLPSHVRAHVKRKH